MELLLGSDDAELDQDRFFKTPIIFRVLAATDGNGNNSSIAQLPGGRYRATVIYDVSSAHPVIGLCNRNWSDLAQRLVSS